MIRIIIIYCFCLLMWHTTISQAEPDNSDFDAEFQYLVAEGEAIRVVTASKLLEAIDKAPGSVVVVTQEQIQQRGYNHLLELLEDLPGIDIQRGNNPFYPNRVTIRGVVDNNKFLILQDGVKISAATNTLFLPIDHNYPLYYAKQVEIVYGPASALYGADAFTGIINIITQDPGDVDGIRLDIEAGEFAYQRAQIYAGKAFNDNISIALGGQFHESDNPDLDKEYPDFFALNDLVDFGGNVALAAEDRQGFKGDSNSYNSYAKINLGEDLTLGWYQSSFKQNTTVSFSPDIVDYGANAEAETFLATLYGNYRFRLNDTISGNMQASYSLYEMEPESKIVNIFTDFKDGFKYAKGERFQIEPQLNFTWDQHSLITGLTLERFSSTPLTADLNKPFDPDVPATSQGLFYPGSNDTLPIKIFDVDYQNVGGFVQFKSQWHETLSTTLGARFDHSSNYGDTFNPRLAVIYQPSHKNTLKFLYGEAFLAPAPVFQYRHFGAFTGTPNDQGLFESFFFRIPNKNLNPEKMKTVEIQFSHHFHRDFITSLSIYQQKVDDILLLAATPETVSDFIPGGELFFTDNFDNIGEIEALGADLSFSYNWRGKLSELDLWGNYSFVDGTLSNTITNSEIFVPFTAKQKANMGFTYSYRDKYIISPSMRWVGKTAGFVTETSDSAFGRSFQSYFLVDLYASIKDITDGLSLNLRVNNVFDKHYSNASNYPQDTRWIRLGLKYQY